MGRGRAKAKQTKVARRLKYHSPNTDLAALQRELASDGTADEAYEDDDEVEVDETYGEVVDEYADVGQDVKDPDDRELREEDWLPRKR